MIDLIVLVIVALCVLRGYLRGVVLALVCLGALVFAYAGSIVLGPGVARFLADQGMPGVWAWLVGPACAGMAIYISLRVAGSLLDRKLGRTRRGDLHAWNRKLGMLGGLVVGLLISLCVLFLVDGVLKAAGGSGDGRLVRAARASRLRRMVSDYNPANRFIKVVELLRILGRHPDLVQQIDRPAHLQELLERQAVRDVLNEPDLMEAWQEKRYDDLLENEKLRAVWDDEELREMLFSQETLDALNQMADEAREKAASESEQADAPEGDETPDEPDEGDRLNPGPFDP